MLSNKLNIKYNLNVSRNVLNIWKIASKIRNLSISNGSSKTLKSSVQPAPTYNNIVNLHVGLVCSLWLNY